MKAEKSMGDARRRRYVELSEVLAVVIFLAALLACVFFAVGLHGRPIIGKPACEYPQQMWGEPQRVYLECLREQQRRFLGNDIEQWRLAP